MGMNRRLLGKHELQERLGSDTVGNFWKAFDTQQLRYVTIKIVPLHASTGVTVDSRFLHEAQILLTLHHPNIVPVQDVQVAESGNEAYVIMDYVEGTSLSEYLNTTGRRGNIPPPAEIVNLLAPVADALDYAHQRNVIHGAIRPSAILLGQVAATSSAPGEPKLTDFALNQLQNPLSLPLSSVPYLSPEIAQGFAGTKRSDLYALGVILYELCTGALPFHGDTASDILMQTIHGNPISPALINPHIPPALTAVILRGIAKDATARYASATALVSAVARSLHIDMPELQDQAQSSLRNTNPRSEGGFNGLSDTMNSPTYLIQQPSQSHIQEPSVPPVTADSPFVAPPPPAISSPASSLAQTPAIASTPVIPVATTGGYAYVQIPPVPPAPVPQAIASPVAPSPMPIPTVHRRSARRRFAILAAILLIVLIGSASLGAYLLKSQGVLPPKPVIIGQAFFLSSGVLGDTNTNTGITDELQVNLHNLPNPQPGKLYYAWLLNDEQIDLPAVAIGSLPLNRSQVSLTYSEPQHYNLLTNYNHFLITEEDASQPPANPSLDPATWRYSAVFSTKPSPADTVNHFSLFDHLRHLLAQDPKLKSVGLGGGLDIWLFRNTSKVLEAAGSARDAQKDCTSAPDNPTCAFIHRALVRILDYLDSSAYVQTDIPPNTPLYINPTFARVALLEFDVLHQQPPGYLRHIGTHLREIAVSPGVTPEQHALAIRITQAINNVQGWLETVHADTVKLEKMDNGQMSSSGAASLLNDLFTSANRAFVGQFDPNTGTVMEGVVQIHNSIQSLATFNVTLCTLNNGKSSCS